MTRSLSVSRRTLLGGAAAVTGALAVPGSALAAPGRGKPATDDVPINYHGYTKLADWWRGHNDGTVVWPGRKPGVVIARPVGTTSYTDPHTSTTREYEYATWTSPVYKLDFGATELVSSWNADTPEGTWIQVEMQGSYTTGNKTPWYVMGRWTAGDSDADIRRTSLDGQGDEWSGVYTDTFAVDSDDAANGVLLTDYQLRLTLYRPKGSHATPLVYRLGAFASTIPARFDVPVSTYGLRGHVEIDVPTFSQDIHAGQYPEYDNGGEAWCSPTSTTMVLYRWGKHPTARQLAWVDPSYADPQVDYSARYTYDYQYEGCGNWPFNAAYAATYGGLDCIVTQIRSLNEAERLVAHGIPVVCSVSFYASELDGAGYNTSGHLLVIVGFTADGDVIVNDPASADDSKVRHVYERHQFETIWLRTKRHLTSGGTGSGSGGVAYLYKASHLPWPQVTDRRNPNWG
ncbi:membrane protein [Actinocatenispora thailandica]|uniref:Membrane protein n=1 Tax=Actinocatenispora thailandica TaxID=227318 RepID=A0A7R7DUM0_9ACTN|nr:C39 family peptidase [Actinocatenispora thailandica]BCJ38066.1 membrane protein [Actinocatenispora thailandica]